MEDPASSFSSKFIGINFILIVILVIFSAFFSGSETAIFSLSKSKFRKLKERYPRAKRLNVVFKRPSFYLSAIVFGNMLVNIALSSLIAYTFINIWGQKGFFLSLLFSLTLILFFGEIFPKTLAIYAQDKFSLVSASVLPIFARVFYPVLKLLGKVVDKVSSIFFKKIEELTEEEVKEAILIGESEGSITEAEKDLISSVLEFKDTWVSEIMVHRVEVKAIRWDYSQEEVLKILRRVKHSKFPVYRDSLDNIVGVIYAKDVFLNPQKDWHVFVRKPIFVPENKKIDDVLKIFLETKERIAIVIDEYGGTSGIVTLEDVEEEIFGEIYDEFESPEKPIEKVDEKIFRVSGKVPLKTLNLELKLNLPEDEDNLAGFILSLLERVPRPQEKILYKNIEFTIERATAKRIVSVILKIK